MDVFKWIEKYPWFIAITVVLLIWNMAAYNTAPEFTTLNYSNEIQTLATAQGIGVKPIDNANQPDLATLTYAVDSNRWNPYTLLIPKGPRAFIDDIGPKGRIYKETQWEENATTQGFLIVYWGLNDSRPSVVAKYVEDYLSSNTGAAVTQTPTQVSFRYDRKIAMLFPITSSIIWIIVCGIIWVSRQKNRK